jgi:type IV secretion system protein VirB10
VQDKSGFSANGTTGSGKDAASIAVEQTAAIAPTLHKHQGELVSIFVSRDLDFSSVYDLQKVSNNRPYQSRTRASVRD